MSRCGGRGWPVSHASTTRPWSKPSGFGVLVLFGVVVWFGRLLLGVVALLDVVALLGVVMLFGVVASLAERQRCVLSRWWRVREW
jgi:hypothetical protein